MKVEEERGRERERERERERGGGGERGFRINGIKITGRTIGKGIRADCMS